MKQKYDFDELTQRRDTGSVKWDTSEDAEMLPLWVADMDFATAPPVIAAVKRRAATGIYGYVSVPNSYYEATQRWFSTRHGWKPALDSVIPIAGIVPALSTIIKALVPEGDGVIFQTPAYNCFFGCTSRNNRHEVHNPLVRHETCEGFTYTMNFEEMERLCSNPRNRLLLLCNPHNPTGRVWTRNELERIHDICRRNDVIVLADEIHCELVHPGYKYIPYATIDDNCITCCSPSKGFNIAGLGISNIVVPDAQQRAAIRTVMEADESGNLNPFGVDALQAAYNEGGEWLDELNGYLYSNYLYLRKVLASWNCGLRVCDSESTYLAWVDIRGLGITSSEVEQLGKRGHVWVNSGEMYGGEGYIRINYATQRERLREGLERLREALLKS